MNSFSTLGLIDSANIVCSTIWTSSQRMSANAIAFAYRVSLGIRREQAVDIEKSASDEMMEENGEALSNVSYIGG